MPGDEHGEGPHVDASGTWKGCDRCEHLNRIDISRHGYLCRRCVAREAWRIRGDCMLSLQRDWDDDDEFGDDEPDDDRIEWGN